VTGIPIPDLLNASHIMPWSAFPEHRIDPRNGLCLAVHFDRAFDCGLITFSPEMRLVLSPELKGALPNEAIDREFVYREGVSLRLPERFAPSEEFLAYHRENIFLR
jgi:putative restriction endonuclease